MQSREFHHKTSSRAPNNQQHKQAPDLLSNIPIQHMTKYVANFNFEVPEMRD